MNFQSTDRFHISSAIGWLELGNPIEANEELEKISAPLRAHPEVLSLRVEIYWAMQKWAEVHTISLALIRLQPGLCSHWTDLACAARRKADGSLTAAKEILLKAAELFPKEALICYNLSCYETQLGDLTNAKHWLDKAYKLGNRKHIQHLVLTDPDLEPLRQKFNLSS